MTNKFEKYDNEYVCVAQEDAKYSIWYMINNEPYCIMEGCGFVIPKGSKVSVSRSEIQEMLSENDSVIYLITIPGITAHYIKYANLIKSCKVSIREGLYNEVLNLECKIINDKAI